MNSDRPRTRTTRSDRLPFTVLSMVANFHDPYLGRARGRKGEGRALWKAAQAQPPPSGAAGQALRTGEQTTLELAELIHVSRAALYRAIKKADVAASIDPNW